MALIGEQLAGEYEIVEALGFGATSVVYKSVRITDGKLFAIKLLHNHLLEKTGTLKRFEQEARATMLLSHPNIIKVHAINKTPDGQPYLIMEHVEGTSLAQLVGSDGFDLGRAWKLFIQIADAMNHAHVHGVVHRSLKPSNIIVTAGSPAGGPTGAKGEEQAMVSDFGLAKLLPSSGQELQALTARGAVIGSPLYMSPEQCLGREIDQRSDIYSMGCLMYACIAGKPPHKGEHIIETMSRHVSEIAPTFDRVCPQLKIPESVQSIVFKCLAKRPQDRYESMEALKQDLIAFQEGKPPQSLLGSLPIASNRSGEAAPLTDDRVLKRGMLVILVLLAGLSAYAFWKVCLQRNLETAAGGVPTAVSPRSLHPISSLALLKQADELTLMNRDEEARAMYREVVAKAADRDHEQSPVDNEVLATAHFGLATLFKKMFDWLGAEKETRMALYVQGLSAAGSAPGKDRLLIELADCLMHQGKLDEARQVLISLQKETVDVLVKARADLMLADLCRVEKNDAGAESFELAALEILKGAKGIARREYCSVLARYSDYLIRQKQFASCIARLKAAINERPPAEWGDHDPEAAVFLTVETARAFACTGDYREARDACQSMLNTIEDASLNLTRNGIKVPDTGILVETIAALTTLSGNAAAAEKSLAVSLAFEGERLGRIAAIARIMIFDKRALEAMAFLSKYREAALKQPPSKAEYHALIAQVLMQQKRNEEALKEVDEAIAALAHSNEEDLHLYCLQVKCQVLRQLQRAEAAEVIEKRIGTVNPSSASFDFLLPAYERRGI